MHNNVDIVDNFVETLENIMFPYVDKRGIKSVVFHRG